MAHKRILFDDRLLGGIIKKEELVPYNSSLAVAEKMLAVKSGPGNDFLGWLDLPTKTSRALTDAVIAKAQEIRGKADVLVCIGIGGSYLGARAAIDFLSPSLEDLRKPRVLFAGHTINSDYLADLLALVKDRDVAVKVLPSQFTQDPTFIERFNHEPCPASEK